ncbi:MAG: ankyrin repeat domain-containing protein [Saprospiraceae bacterium]|nr:ankyrin repeat domain-containing protein [Saprospiraceae bacterium]
MKNIFGSFLMFLLCSGSLIYAQQDLRLAVDKSDTRFVKEWISQGHDVNSVLYLNEQKMTLLSYSASVGNAEMVQLLLSRGADVHFKIEFEDALMFAAKSGNLEVLETLLKAGANPMNENKIGKCARDIAQDHKQTAAYNLLKLETEKRLSALRAKRGK